ncbi:MAG: ribonuclease III, partial [Pseudomonadota bacterium]
MTARRRGAAAERGALEAALGWRFAAPELLDEALTHASASEGRRDNERLEFLGDRVLGLLTAEALHHKFPGADEGGLAARLNALVRKETCAEVATAIGLGDHLVLAKGEALTGGRRKTAVLGDAMEAVIAAIYLDGGLSAAQGVFEKLWGPRLDTVAAAPRDPKTTLQEWAQAQGARPPTYALAGREGPDHAPRFRVTVALELPGGERRTATGAGG